MTQSLAIVGFGSAGRSRLRALESLPNIRLGGIISRRDGMGTRSFDDVLKDSTVDAVAISTENTDHPLRVKACLEAGKHVLCDYPLAFDRNTAQSLFDLAAQMGRVLHVEHIGLLAEAHQKARQNIQTMGKLNKGSYVFEAGWNEKISNPRFSGPLHFLCISRLMQVADLLGSFHFLKSSFAHDATSLDIQLTLQLANGSLFDFVEKRQVGLKRQRHFYASFEKGDVKWESEPSNENLFHKDLEIFFRRIDKKMSCYYDEKIMLDVIGLLEHKGGVS